MKYLCFRLQILGDQDCHSVFACMQFVQHMPMRLRPSGPPVMACGAPEVLDTAGWHIPDAFANLSPGVQISEVQLGLYELPGVQKLEKLFCKPCQINEKRSYLEMLRQRDFIQIILQY